ncbi:MAG: YceD family protein [Polyangiaceae bacterium]
MALLPAAMAAHEFEIPVSDFDASGKDYTFPLRAIWLRGVLEGTEIKSGGSDGEVSVRVSKSGTDVVVHGHLHAELITPCARCLNDANVVVDGALSVLMVPTKKLARSEPAKSVAKSAKSADKSEARTEEKTDKKSDAPQGHKKGKKGRSEEDDEFVFSPDEADVAPYDGDTVVLDDIVKDEILLEIPMIPLCSEDCPGISPPAAEADVSAAKAESEADHIDPRLLPLLELKKRS